jgi:hypothetical protein
MANIVPVEVIAAKILIVRGKKVMLDSDLAKLYGVETKHLTRQVRRNIERFPSDFLVRLTRQEYKEILRCQIGALEKGKFSKYLPFAFTQEGVAMLSGVLSSPRAIQVNIQIMRAFVRLRNIFSRNKELSHKLEELEKRIEGHDADIRDIFEAIRQLMCIPDERQKITGFADK